MPSQKKKEKKKKRNKVCVKNNYQVLIDFFKAKMEIFRQIASLIT